MYKISNIYFFFLKYKYKLIIFVFVLFNLIIELVYKNKILNICICTIGKLENKYINEFLEYYHNYGVDKIFLYDNNDINGETFMISPKYIKDNYIEIINWRGQKKRQLTFFENCYKNNYKNYDWFIFYDIDEYLNLTNYSDIHQYLSQSKFQRCQLIYLYWRLHTDNDKMFFENKTLFERFPNYYNRNDYFIGKSIIRGNIDDIFFDSPHYIDNNLKKCNDIYYIEHYEFKSTEEFINKINYKGDVRFENNEQFKYKRIFRYFKFNKISFDKIIYIANKTKLNATFLISKLLSNDK